MDAPYIVEGLLGILMMVGAGYVNVLKGRIEHNEMRIEKMEDRFSEVTVQLARVSGQLELMNSRMARFIEDVEHLTRRQ